MVIVRSVLLIPVSGSRHTTLRLIWDAPPNPQNAQPNPHKGIPELLSVFTSKRKEERRLLCFNIMFAKTDQQ